MDLCEALGGEKVSLQVGILVQGVAGVRWAVLWLVEVLVQHEAGASL